MKKTLPQKKLITVSLLLVLFVVFTALVLTGTLKTFENKFYNSLTIKDGWTVFFKIFSIMGSWYVLSAIILLLIILPWTRKKYGYPIAVLGIINLGLNNLLKVIFRRPRPEILRLVKASGFSFPSGHAQNNAAIFILLAVLIFLNVKNKWIKIPLIIFCSILPLVIGLSRIYLGVHYFGDVLCGFLLGAILTLSVKIIWEHLEKKLPENKFKKFLF